MPARTMLKWGSVVLVLGIGILTATILIIDKYKDPYSVTPTTHDGQKWRLAYYEGGTFYDYAGHLRAIVNGLVRLGWMEPVTFPDTGNPDDTRALWDYLAGHARSRYIEFVPDAYWSANWDETLRQQTKADALRRLAAGNDIDLIIAMGTWAGLDLANNDHTVPTVVVSTSNAIDSGIVHSADDSGFDHVQAWVDPDQYVRQVRLFHDIVRFKTLGIVYDDTPDGRVYANLDEIEQVARERGFKVVGCVAPDSGLSEDEARQEAERCFNELAPQVDAVWLGAHLGIHARFMPDELEVLYAHGVATWSQEGVDQVEHGALLSIARKDLNGIGLWTAEVIAKILNGARPRDLSQIYEQPNAILINIEAARRTGFIPPDSLLKVADRVYDTLPADAPDD